MKLSVWEKIAELSAQFGPPNYSSNWTHRFNDPSSNATIYLDLWDNGELKYCSYWEDGRQHRPRDEGPALEIWQEDGSLLEKSYIEYGDRILRQSNSE
jgi:hypothetical protein